VFFIRAQSRNKALPRGLDSARGNGAARTYTDRMPSRLPAAVLTTIATLALGACAGAPAQEIRVLVKLTQASGDTRVIAEQASRSSGATARYLAAAGGSWHSIALACLSSAECDAALARLQGDTAHFESVQRDERKRATSP
jgi:hypothetical protein